MNCLKTILKFTLKQPRHVSLQLHLHQGAHYSCLLQLQLGRVAGTLHEYHLTFFIISGSVLLKMINVSDKRCRGNQNTHFVFTDFFFRKSCRLWDNVEKYCRAELATNDSMVYSHCMVDTKDYEYTHTHRLCNAHYFSTCTNAPHYYVIRTLPFIIRHDFRLHVWRSDICTVVHWSHASREPAYFGKRPIVQTALFSRCWIFHIQINDCCKVLGVDNFCLKFTCIFLPEQHITCTHDKNSLQSYTNTVSCVDSAGVKLTQLFRNGRNLTLCLGFPHKSQRTLPNA